MGYLNEDGLARYDGLIKNWTTFKSGTVDGIDPLLNWQKTETAGVVTCYPLPAAPLDPVVNFAFTETEPASGEKGPENPSTITGVNSVKVTRCGKNLFNMAGISGFTQNGVTFVVDSNAGTVTVTSDGPATADTTFYVAIWPNMKMYADQQYFLSGCPAGGSATTYYLGGSFYSEDDVYGRGMASDFGSGALLVKEFNWRYNCIIKIRSGVTVSNLVFKPQLELGSAATAFEPYSGADYTVNLGGTSYGGSVNLSAGTMTVDIHKDEISSILYPRLYTAQTVTSTYVTFELLADKKHKGSGNHAITSNILPGDSFDAHGSSSSSVFLVRMPKDALDVSGAADPSNPTEAEWNAAMNAFLAVTPIELVYYPKDSVVASLTPTQIYSLSQPDPYTPRLNTVYSDQTSVQMGYPKSPLATSTELTNAIISLGGNV